MKKIALIFWKSETRTVILLMAVAFFARIISLSDIPIFTDEAIYVRWAQIGLNDPSHRFLSLTDGKQPLFIWLSFFLLPFIKDPLIAARLVSVFSGIAASIGIYLTGKALFSKRTALIASVIYIFSPFALIYDRLALMDSLLASIGIWCLYLSIIQAKKTALDKSLIAGGLIGAGLLTKSSAFFYLLLFPFSYILNQKNKIKIKERLRQGVFLAISAVVSLVIYNILRLSPYFYIISQKNNTFVYGLKEFLEKPFFYFLPNLNGLLGFLWGYTQGLLIVIIAGLALAFYKKDRRVFLPFIWFAVPFFALTAFGKVLFPRFIFFMTVPLYLVGAYFIDYILSLKGRVRSVLIGIILVIITPYLYLSFNVLIKPSHAKIITNDRNQLFDDWPSGWGVREAIEILEARAKENKIVILTEGTFGLNPAVYEIYLHGKENIRIFGYWPLSRIDEKTIGEFSGEEVFLILKESAYPPMDLKAELVYETRRGSGQTFFRLYRLLP